MKENAVQAVIDVLPWLSEITAQDCAVGILDFKSEKYLGVLQGKRLNSGCNVGDTISLPPSDMLNQLMHKKQVVAVVPAEMFGIYAKSVMNPITVITAKL